MNYQKNAITFGKKLKIVSKENLTVNHYATKNEKYLKAKIKFYNGKISRRFRNNKIPTEGSQLFYIFFLHVKMANKYYQKHKEKLQKEARERYQNISEKEKEKKASLSSDEENFDEEN